MKRHSVHGYGTARDRADTRDHRYAIPNRLRGKLPGTVDLRRNMPPVYNQQHLNSCSANAIGAALWFDARRHHPRVPSPSRLFIYYHERVIEHVVKFNAAVSLRNGYKTVASVGVCSEQHWPYDIRRYRRKPTPACFTAAAHHKAIDYSRLPQTLKHMRACLAEGHPFVMAIAVHKTFKSKLVKRTGVISVPNRLDPLLGGHAVLVVGYEEDSRHFIVRNSWGTGWGDRGYCYLPYHYMLNTDLAWDPWTVRRIT